ncbi:cation diffusion facilitator CzcD-associated flavoprotein CzcO [Sphingomonas sp. PP-F2F-A104-K0414]|uniref:flavin-containing monooxygenase n=1 Tax=Sphingomonas sp. PP-F2F-A104-K0414 TaxID=2135661 RepID=UPI0010D8D91B|nr:NAD(P)/FAD-dependent oxidoreductase [Sphingomonas sp. PP-F2F-A104-K0414]TCP96389.1 cation diffusion facilitator CzcD-associated flavoprotein CzcO [Sphingomonas sp. PP-F2F-A104-K0414]
MTNGPDRTSQLVEAQHPQIQRVDVLIVGAGLSGVGAAVHLQRNMPTKSYAIVEARDALGGTWDLFRYPGIRSDSDMYTLGYAFKPWTGEKSIVDGSSIRDYITEAAVENGVDRHIRYDNRVTMAEWRSGNATWTVTSSHRDGSTSQIECNFLLMCSGYYSYTDPHRPHFEGEEDFAGRIVHPQFWPGDLDWRGKRVVVIGSGATAVTLIPSMAETAAHVTMLQRTPTYVASRPAVDRFAHRLRRILSPKLAYRLTRVKSVLVNQFVYSLSRKHPTFVKKLLLKQAQSNLGPTYDVGKHFTPPYNPWDQRLCAVPDGDLFATIRRGRASVVTETISRFTSTGISLTTGKTLPADIIITATGLKLNLLGEVKFVIDGTPKDMSETMNYRGSMFSDTPNLASMFGYTNASWTLKSDLASAYICRILKKMEDEQTPIVVPRRDPTLSEEPFIDLQSGFFLRAKDAMPKQGSKHPWKLYQNYMLDFINFRFGKLDDGTLEFMKSSQSCQIGSSKSGREVA